VLLEPIRRDSGPAIAAGAALRRCATRMPWYWRSPPITSSAIPCVCRRCREGLIAADAGRIVTFGVQPERAATEYGYISPGEVISGEVRSVVKFVEKPDPVTAAGYISAGYLWNSATSCFVRRFCSMNTAASMRKASRPSPIPCSRPDAISALSRWTRPRSDRQKAISIDYAVMEKTSRAAVVPVACGWSDVGSWLAVWELSDKDVDGNATQGTAVFEDSRNCNVSTDKALVALEGVDDLVVVATQDAVLVSRQKDANGLKRLVAN